MKLPIVAVLVLATALTGCSRLRESRLNPLNWFGSMRPTVVTTLYVPPNEKRPLVTQVTDLKVEPYPGGAIVRATGLPPTQGYWKAELVEGTGTEPGQMVFEFRIYPPIDPVASGTPYSRQITAAAAVSSIKLQGVTSITVQSSTNALVVRR